MTPSVDSGNWKKLRTPLSLQMEIDKSKFIISTLLTAQNVDNIAFHYPFGSLSPVSIDLAILPFVDSTQWNDVSWKNQSNQVDSDYMEISPSLDSNDPHQYWIPLE